MKKVLSGFIVLSLGLFVLGRAVTVQAAIIFLSETHADAGAGSASVSLPVTIGAGETVIVVVSEALATVQSVTDNGGSVYTKKTSSAGARETEIWATLSASSATSLTVTMTSATSIKNISVLRYSGVSGFGNIGSSSGSGTNPSVTLTASQAGNIIVAGFGLNSNPGTCGSFSGSVRTNCFAEQQGSQRQTVVETSAGSAGSIANSFSTTNTSDWQGAALELVMSGSTPPPSLPTISSFTASPSSITSGQSSTLSWSVSGSPTPTVTITPGNPSTSSGSTPVSPSQSTTYTLTATNSQGSASANITVTVSAVSDTQAPSTPANLSASTVSSSQINLSWSASSDNVGVTGYDIYRNGSLLTSTSNTNYSSTGLTANTLYSYTVRARDAAGNTSSQSSSVSATTQAQVTGARTFYIDFVSGNDSNNGTAKATPWKRAPGMSGFTGSYVKQNGDTFVFKGGVTWTSSFPWTFQNGASGLPMTYTTDKAWYSGGSFSQPTFDRQAGGQMAVGASFITLNDLKFINCGAPQVANSIKCLQFDNTREVSITNSTFATEAWISIFFVFTLSGNYSNFVWTGNDFSRTSGAIWFASAAANTQMRNITYNNNVFHDFSSQIGADVHGDGAWHGYVIPGTDSSQFMDNMQFCNNRFYGDFRRSFGTSGAMTAFFFHEGGLQNALICNNEMGFSPVQSSMFDGFIVLEGESNTHSTGVQILNNSMANIGANAMSAGIHISGSYNNVTVKNNIISGMQYPYYIEDPAGTGATFVSDYNLLNGASGQLVWGSAFQNYTTWKAGGRDVNSVLGSDPSWVSAPSNLSLNSNSPAVNKGTNLSGLGQSILNSDKNNVSRASAWDIGAFEYTGGGAPTTYTVSASAGSGGSISPSGFVPVSSGGSQTFSISPSIGYIVSSILVDGVSQGAITSYTFTNVTANHSIIVSFTPVATPIPGDLNLDHIVNTLDFSLLNSRWNTNYPAYDLVADGVINSLDFAILSSNWNRTW